MSRLLLLAEETGGSDFRHECLWKPDHPNAVVGDIESLLSTLSGDFAGRRDLYLGDREFFIGWHTLQSIEGWGGAFPQPYYELRQFWNRLVFAGVGTAHYNQGLLCLGDQVFPDAG